MQEDAVDEAIAAIRRAGRYALDLETTGLNPRSDRIISVNLATGTKSWGFKFVGAGALPFTLTMERLKVILHDEKLQAILHNAKFDIQCLWAAGYDIAGPLVDTMIVVWMLDESLAGSEGLSLRSQALVELGIDLKPFTAFQKAGDLNLGGEGIEEKGVEDAAATLKLWDKLQVRLKKDARLWKCFHELEMPNVRVIAEMESAGVVVDLPWMWDLKKKMEEAARGYEAKVHEIAGRKLLLSSTEQVSQLLFGQMGLEPKPFMRRMPAKFQLKKPGPGGVPLWSTREEVLSEYAAESPIAELLLDHRQTMKLVSTNVVPFIEIASADPENRIHTHFWQAGTETGRLSSSDPVNLQNLPRDAGKIRRGMIAPPGCVLVYADYSQLELRLMAHLSKDPLLLQAYLTGQDIHQQTMDKLGIKERTPAKCLVGGTIVFATRGPRTIESMIGGLEPDEHREIAPQRLADGRGGWVGTHQGLVRHERPCTLIVTKRAVVCCTNDHRWLLKGGELLEAERLKKGDVLPVGQVPPMEGGEPRRVKVNPFTNDVGDGPCELVLDERWGYFAGMFHGDGSNVNGHQFVISHGDAPEYAAWRQEVAKACWDVGLPVKQSGDQRTTRIGCRVVARMLSALGLATKKGKRLKVPDWVIEGGERVAWAYVAGLIDTDGTVDDNLSFTTKDAEFAGQVALILRSLGCVVSISPNWNKPYQKWYFRVLVLGVSLGLAAERCPLRSEKREQLRVRAAAVTVRAKDPGTDEVVLVLPAGNRTVYDFHVDSDDHLYLQGGLIGHNNVNFGVIYDIHAPRLQKELWVKARVRVSLNDCERWIIKFFDTYAGVKRYHNEIARQIKENGYVRSLVGRFRRVKRLLEDEARGIGKPGYAFRVAVNFTVQGSGADLTMIAMRNFHRELVARRAQNELWKRVRLVVQVHDSLTTETPIELAEEVLALKRRVMETAITLPSGVPIIANAGIGKSWEDAELDAKKRESAEAVAKKAATVVGGA